MNRHSLSKMGHERDEKGSPVQLNLDHWGHLGHLGDSAVQSWPCDIRYPVLFKLSVYFLAHRSFLRNRERIDPQRCGNYFKMPWKCKDSGRDLAEGKA